jgi:hypothetical protein
VTVTVAVAVAVSPRGSVQVIVYMVVCVGPTVIESLGGTPPIPWSITHELLLAELQLSVLTSPILMATGLAEIVTAGSTMVTVTLPCTCPPGPLASIPYGRVLVGVTVAVPLVATHVASQSAKHEFAPVVLQVRVLD